MNTIRINSRNSKMVAHRGVSGLEKENTLCAFVAAGNRSYYGVETDVHRTGDGQFAIIHDDNTRRVGGEARVLEVETTDLANLRSLPLQDVDGSDGRVDLRIPTLREYIRCCKKYGKDCVLELKNRIPTEDIARMVAEIREEEYLEHVIFIGFSVENMTDLRQLLPDQTLQLLTKVLDDAVLETLTANRLDVDVYWKALTKEWTDRLHTAGVRINVWTVDDPAVGEQMAEWGVDYITSNILE